ncbi:MAG TPA: hypothetical protein VIY08_14700 [Candidatus Nitrosocosmicus sp.]
MQINIDKNDSGISCEHNLSSVNESLSPYLEGLSPGSDTVSPVETEVLSTKLNELGDNGDNGEKSDILQDKKGNNEHNSKETSSNMDELIGYRAPFYYCK